MIYRSLNDYCIFVEIQLIKMRGKERREEVLIEIINYLILMLLGYF